jgi:hypothetical protein
MSRTIKGKIGAFPLDDKASPVGEVGKYRKTALTLAAQLTEDCVIETPEGDHTAKAGDYLVQASDGHAWPVMKSYFESSNEKVY